MFRQNRSRPGELLLINALREQTPTSLDPNELAAGIEEYVRLGYLRVEEQAAPRIFLTEQGFAPL